MNTDPRQIIANSPMRTLQIVAVALTIGLNALDGFDVLSISYASPGIASEWGIDRAALGIVLSMELIGMALGSMLLGGVADRIGRRPTMLGSLVVMAAGMLAATRVTNVIELSACRVITGLGIGGMLAAINAVATEFSNSRRRHLSVSLMSIGYPLGAVVGGAIASQLLVSSNWRSVFYFGAAVTAAFIPLIYFLVPESLHWLAWKQPAGALQKVNDTLRRLGHAPVAELPSIAPDLRQRSVSDIFRPGLMGVTVLVTLAYFFHVTTFYFIVKWVPKIVADMGFTAASAAGVLVWTNVGGAVGGTILGFLTQRFSVKALTIAVLMLSTIMVALFGRSSADLQQLSLICALAGFCTNAGIVGLYAIIAQVFPTHVRASGTGFAIGVGRGGSVIAPIIAGFLFRSGFGLPLVSSFMAFGSLLAAGVLLLLKFESDRPPAETSRAFAELKDVRA